MSTERSWQRAGSHSVTLGAGDALGAGDSYLVENVLPEDFTDVFEKVRNEVKWDVMHHRGKYRFTA